MTTYAFHPSSDGRARGLVRKPMLIMLVLLGLSFCAALTALFCVADDLNDKADLRSGLLLGKAFASSEESMRFHLSDNAEWGEAYNNLHRTLNLDWAWRNQNLGESLFKTFGYEGVFVIAPSGETRYSVLDGTLRRESFQAWMGQDALNALKQRLQQSDGKAIARLVRVGDQLALLGAAWITPGGDHSVKMVAGPPSIMIFVDRLTPAKLESAGAEYGIKKLSYADAPPEGTGEHDRYFASALGGVVTLKWQSDDPGGALLTWLLPLLALLMCATFFTATMLMRSALRKARHSDVSTFLLEQSQQALAASEQRFRDVAESTTDWIWEADAQLRFTWISGRFPAVTGYHSQDWLQQPLHDFLLDDADLPQRLTQREQPAEPLTLLRCRYRSAQQHIRFCNLTLRPVTLPQGKKGYRGTATDVTLEVEAEARVRYLSQFDELTGLPNRAQMNACLAGKLSDALHSDCPLAVIMIDLDKFKPVNDLYGHAAGDSVLHEVSLRFNACLKDAGMTARLGGDEFVMIVSDIHSEQEIGELCSRIIAQINLPFAINGADVFIGASMGIALAPQDGNNPGDLLRYADIALYKAKNAGRNNWVFYQRDMGEKIVQRREMERELREAIHTNQLRLAWQPRYDVRSARVTAVEALVRWHHRQHGVLMPDQFIPLAEETGLIGALSDWVLLRACEDTHRDLPGLAVSVNLSAVEFSDKGLPRRIRAALDATGLPSSRLEIEVTENAMLQDPETTLEVMLAIKALGVKFLIDDFGTGYASLNYLRTFPFDGIKIDKSFIFPLNDSSQARQIVENMVGLGKAYSLSVTAEGVETASQMEQLKLMECDGLQGYYLGKPQPLAQIVETYCAAPTSL
ncbi:MAG: EAL domain-containing protein [Pantoea sp.]|uniref:bifunctional diguanylate cyclase/phosphodiesterase n=1 Tax=Pantoea TaxID=53335 RepID=UPI0028AC4E83|nr:MULTISPECIES: EAL domain-containing protein [Pantoea]MDU1572329.1 EAL domain-containing protein [Pantoea sp.]